MDSVTFPLLSLFLNLFSQPFSNNAQLEWLEIPTHSIPIPWDVTG